MTDRWPWDDDKLERRSRIAHMYRDVLSDIDAAACAELDEVMAVYGQMWILDTPEPPPDTLMTADDIAAWADVSKRTVEKWVERGHIERRVNADKQIVFLLADMREFQKGKSA